MSASTPEKSSVCQVYNYTKNFGLNQEADGEKVLEEC
jgi:hypothetical protein